MADINKEQALKDAKILLDTIGILSSKSGRQTVGGTQYSWHTHNEIGNTVAELDKILNKYTSSYSLNLLEEAYLEINQKSKRFVSDKEKLRIRELKKNNPNLSLLELDLLDEGKESVYGDKRKIYLMKNLLLNVKVKLLNQFGIMYMKNIKNIKKLLKNKNLIQTQI